MFRGLLVHPATSSTLEAQAKNPPHALLLSGPEHIGKLTLAKVWAEHVASKSTTQIIAPDEKGGIGIETVRGLYQAARSKSEGNQVIIIDQAHAMSVEAQNALLKLLEEPRLGLSFVLTAPYTNALLPTIVSRVQQVMVRPLPDDVLAAWLPESSDKNQMLFIAQGRPAMLAMFLNDASTFQAMRTITQRAKDLLSAKLYARLVALGSLASDRSQCIATLEAMLHIASLQLIKGERMEHWLRMSEALESTLLALSRNANTKAQLLKFFSAY